MHSTDPLLLLAALALLSGCPPTLGNDDDATMDDDDVADDDDIADDDDSVDPEGCDSPGNGFVSVTGPPPTGQWMQGSMSNADGALVLTTDTGEELVWRLGDDAAMLPGALGAGRIWWEAPNRGPWGGDFALAVEWADATERLLLASVVDAEVLAVDDWMFEAVLDRAACTESWFEDFCGIGQVLPIEMTLSTTQGIEVFNLVPGMGVGSPELSVEHRYGLEYVELLCDDVPLRSWAFALRQSLIQWDGLGGR